MNGWFYGDTLSRRLRQQVDIGIAVDTEEGLFVPVLRNVSERSPEDLRAGLNALREDVLNRSIPGRNAGCDHHFVKLRHHRGRYANPIVVPLRLPSWAQALCERKWWRMKAALPYTGFSPVPDV